MTISDPKGKIIDNQMGYTKLEKKFDVKVGGQYQLCITNTDGQAI